MRRLVVLGGGVAYLMFGVLSGAAHVHESADHHAQARGLHLGHVHLGHAAGHEPEGHRRNSDRRATARHVEHHDADAVYLTATVLAPGSGPRAMPATVSVGAALDPPVSMPLGADERPRWLRGPPRRGPTPPRAPPA
jgi:hypothetical protein